LNIIPYKFLRINQEEVHVAGNEGQGYARCIMVPNLAKSNLSTLSQESRSP